MNAEISKEEKAALIELGVRTLLLYRTGPDSHKAAEAAIANKANWLVLFNAEDCHYVVGVRKADDAVLVDYRFDYHDFQAIFRCRGAPAPRPVYQFVAYDADDTRRLQPVRSKAIYVVRPEGEAITEFGEKARTLRGWKHCIIRIAELELHE